MPSRKWVGLVQSVEDLERKGWNSASRSPSNSGLQNPLFPGSSASQPTLQTSDLPDLMGQFLLSLSLSHRQTHTLLVLFLWRTLTSTLVLYELGAGEKELETSGDSGALLSPLLAHCVRQPSTPKLLTPRNGLFLSYLESRLLGARRSL